MKAKLLLLLGLAFGLPLLTLAQPADLFNGSAGSSTTGNPLADAGALIAALLVVGAILKNAVPQFPNRFIPLVTMLGGTVGYMLMTDSPWSSGKAWFTSLLVAASATGIHSGIKNTVQGVGEKLVTLAFTASFLLLSASACSAMPRAVITVTSVMDSAAKEYAAAHVDGRVTPEMEVKIQAAWKEYQKAAGIAHDAYAAAVQAKDPAGKVSALKSIKAAASPVLDLMFPISPASVSGLQARLIEAKAP